MILTVANKTEEAMFLKKTPLRTGRIHLAKAEGYRKDVMNRTRTVENLDYLDEFVDTYPDPFALFTALVREMTERERERTALVTIVIHPMQKIDKHAGLTKKNNGCTLVPSHYSSLGLERAQEQLKAAPLRMGLELLHTPLVTERILNWAEAGDQVAHRDPRIPTGPHAC